MRFHVGSGDARTYHLSCCSCRVLGDEDTPFCKSIAKRGDARGQRALTRFTSVRKRRPYKWSVHAEEKEIDSRSLVERRPQDSKGNGEAEEGQR